MKRRLGLQALVLAAAIGLSQVGAAVLQIWAARLTDPSAFGAAAVALSIGLVGAAIVDFGQNSLIVRDYANGQLDPPAAFRLLVWKSAVAFGVFTSAAMVAGLVHWLGGAGLAWYVLLAGGVVLTAVLEGAAGAVLRLLERSHHFAAAVCLDRLFAFIVFVLVLRVPIEPGTAMLLAWGVGQLFGTGVALLLAAREWRAKRGFPRARYVLRWVSPWRGAAGYGWSSVVGQAQPLDVVMVGVVGGSAAAGGYGAVSRWTAPLLLPVNALVQTFQLRLARARDIRLAFHALWPVGLIVVLPVVAGATGALLAGPLTGLLLGAAYAAVAPAFALLALAVIPASLSVVLAAILQAQGHDMLVARVLTGGLVIRLGMCLLAGTLGAAAGALGVLVQQVITVALLAFAVRAYWRRTV